MTKGRPVYVPSWEIVVLLPLQFRKCKALGIMSCWQADVATGKARCTYKHLLVDVIKVVGIYDISKQSEVRLEFVLSLAVFMVLESKTPILCRILEGIHRSPHGIPVHCPDSPHIQ